VSARLQRTGRHGRGNLAPVRVIIGTATMKANGQARLLTDRCALSSSVIASVAYDAPTKTLQVEFRTGRVYWYLDVPQSEFEGLMQASSAGAYFNHEIRDRYAFREIV